MTPSASPTAAPVRCSACGDVVGVYEPATFLLADGRAVESSRLRSGEGDAAVATYHRACHAAAFAAVVPRALDP